MPAANLNQLWAQALWDELIKGGVRHAVVCPGSRSAPLALACAQREGDGLLVWPVIDERSAAFFALGMAKESGFPVAVVATSGTAGAHFYPAVIEAAMSHVPLVLLTADRPVELQGWGAPQTVPQQHLYGTFARSFADLGVPEASSAVLLHMRATAARAVATAQASPRGAVHLNVPFREPLAPTPDGVPLDALAPLAAQGRPEGPVCRLVEAERRPDSARLAVLRARLLAEERGVIVCGPRDARDGLREAVLRLSRALGYPVLAEAASGVRYGREGDVVCLYDGLLRHQPFASHHRPAVVLRTGGGLTSKGLQAWLDSSGAYQVLLSDEGALFDPQHAAAMVVEGDPVLACELLADGLAPRGGPWAASFTAAERRARAALDEAFARQEALTEPRIAREVVASLPAGASLFVSSSMPIRDVDAFAFTGAAVRVLASRGANGIDGIVSSALGMAASSGGPAVLLAGDLAFLHDAGGLIAARRLQQSLAIVVVQNDGGGIFSFLPIARFPDHFERLFGTPHGVPLEHAAALAGARYSCPRTPGALRESLAAGLEGGLHVIAVQTDRASNPDEHRLLFATMADALGEGPWV